MLKLNEMNTEEMLDKICDITPFINNIVTDEKVMSVIGDKINADKGEKEVNAFVYGKMFKLIPMFLKDHRDDVLSILAIMTNRTLDEVKKQNFFKTTLELKYLFSNKEIVELFL